MNIFVVIRIDIQSIKNDKCIRDTNQTILYDTQSNYDYYS